MTTFIFAGGGTGGHIFPALAIHEELQDLAVASDHPAKSLFVCSNRPLDAGILEGEDVDFRVLAAQPFGIHPRRLVRFLRTWGTALRSGRRIIREAREKSGEVQVVAMGGFVAAPMARAARLEGMPLTLVNMDAVPGRANRWIASMASHIVTSAPVPERFADWERIPPIVRRSALATGGQDDCRLALALDPSLPTLLVTGASQGARSINRFMIRLVQERAELFRTWQVIHQTGLGEDDAVREAYGAAGIRSVVEPFFKEMGLAWGAADLAVSRAGAGSVAEAWANQTPTLFMPYPYHRDQHQRYNAQPLEEAGGAIIATDLIDERANTADSGPGPILTDLIRDRAKRVAMRSALEQLGPADGARRIASRLLPTA